MYGFESLLRNPWRGIFGVCTEGDRMVYECVIDGSEGFVTDCKCENFFLVYSSARSYPEQLIASEE